MTILHLEAKQADDTAVDLSPDAIAAQDDADAKALAAVPTPSDDDCGPIQFTPLAIMAALIVPSVLAIAQPAIATDSPTPHPQEEDQGRRRGTWQPTRRKRPGHMSPGGSRMKQQQDQIIEGAEDTPTPVFPPLQEETVINQPVAQPSTPTTPPKTGEEGYRWVPNADQGAAGNTLTTGNRAVVKGFAPPTDAPAPARTRGSGTR